MMKYLSITIALFALSLQTGYAKSIWVDKNIYSPAENVAAGDVVIVVVKDISQLRFTMDLNDKSTGTVMSNPDMTITGFLPKVSGGTEISNRDTTSFTGQGKLAIDVATQVTGGAANGKFNIRGTRSYSFNGVTNTITVTGIVDPTLLKGRSIDSAKVANFRLEIRAAKEGITLKREPLKADEKAGVNLTEQEKQDLIIDYLQKMLRELTR